MFRFVNVRSIILKLFYLTSGERRRSLSIAPVAPGWKQMACSSTVSHSHMYVLTKSPIHSYIHSYIHTVSCRDIKNEKCWRAGLGDNGLVLPFIQLCVTVAVVVILLIVWRWRKKGSQVCRRMRSTVFGQ